MSPEGVKGRSVGLEIGEVGDGIEALRDPAFSAPDIETIRRDGALREQRAASRREARAFLENMSAKAIRAMREREMRAEEVKKDQAQPALETRPGLVRRIHIALKRMFGEALTPEG